MRERAVLVLPVGVHDGKRGGQGFGPQMVVQHHDIRRLRRRDRIMGKRAAIDAEDQVMILRQRRHRRLVRPIALVDPVGDIERGLAAPWRAAR